MRLSDEDASAALKLRGYTDEDYVDFIYGLIRGCKWDAVNTVRELAEIWSKSPRMIGSLHRQAKQKIANSYSGETREMLATSLVERMDYVVNSALRAKKPFLTMDGEVVYGDAPDHKSALSGLNMIADLAGLKVKKDKGLSVEYREMEFEKLVALAMKEHGLEYVNTTGEETDGKEPEILNAPPLRIREGETPEPAGVGGERPRPDGEWDKADF